MARYSRTPTSLPLGAYPGVQRQLAVPAPAAGAEWSLQLPAGSWWRLLGGMSTFTSSAAAATRVVAIQYQFGGAPAVEAAGLIAVVATQTYQVNYAIGLGQGAGISGVYVNVGHSFPPMQPGAVLASRTYNLQAADQYGAVSLFMEEIDTGPNAEAYGAAETKDLTPGNLLSFQED